MKPTVSGISQLNAPPGLHSTQEEALDTSEPRYANPRGYADPIQSAYIRTGVNKIMTRFGGGVSYFFMERNTQDVKGKEGVQLHKGASTTPACRDEQLPK